MKKLNIISAIICFVAVFVLFSCKNKETDDHKRPSTHIEEFCEYKIDIPDQFEDREDQIGSGLSPQTVWRNGKSESFQLQLYDIPGSMSIDILVAAVEATYRLYPSIKVRQQRRTDSTLVYSLYNGEIMRVRYLKGIKTINNNCFCYTYTQYSEYYDQLCDNDIYDIINSITLWEKGNVKYEIYKNHEHNFSISYPNGWIVNDSLLEKEFKVSFREKGSQMVYEVIKGKYFYEHPIDSIINLHMCVLRHEKVFKIDEEKDEISWVLQKEDSTCVSYDEDMNPQIETIKIKGPNAHVNKYNAYLYLETGRLNKSEWSSRVYFIKDGDEYYTIRFFCADESAFEMRNKNKIKDILNSFTIY